MPEVRLRMHSNRLMWLCEVLRLGCIAAGCYWGKGERPIAKRVGHGILLPPKVGAKPVAEGLDA